MDILSQTHALEAVQTIDLPVPVSGSEENGDKNPPALSQIDEIMHRLIAVEDNNAMLKEENVALRKEIVSLKAGLSFQEANISDVMAAIIHKEDHEAYDVVVRRVLIDMARNKLAKHFGFRNWYRWMENCDKDGLYERVRQRLIDDPQPSQLKSCAESADAFHLLFFPIRILNDNAVHDTPDEELVKNVFHKPA